MTLGRSSPRVLTFTHGRDMHSVYVSGALDLLGMPNEIVVLDSMLQTGGVSISDGPRGARLSVRDQNIDVALSDLSAHWNRRRPLHLNHSENSFAPDRPYLESCAITVSRSISLSGDGASQSTRRRGSSSVETSSPRSAPRRLRASMCPTL